MLRELRHQSLATRLFIAGLGVTSAATGCSENDATSGEHAPSSESEAGTGSVVLALNAGESVSFASVSYDVTGNGFHKAGEIPAQSTITASIGGIPSGRGFVITLRAVDEKDPALSCAASATFDVVAGRSTHVSVVLRCTLPRATGSVALDGTVNVCPRLDDLTVSAITARVGESIALAAAATDEDELPVAVSYVWSATSGVLGQRSGARSTLSCSAPGSIDVKVVASDSDCSDTLSATVTCLPAQTPVQTVVYATVETVPVAAAGDAADDPAIWVHPTDPGRSVIIGTDKSASGGLGVYGLDGALLQTVTAGALNNVDLRDGFPLAGSTTTLVTAGNRTDNTIAIFSLDAATRTLHDVADGKIGTLATYGSCMYHSPITGKFYYFVDDKAGRIEQWELSQSATAPGKVRAQKVRDLKQLSSQPEACAADDAAGTLYVGEEDVGLWKFDAEPSVTSGPGWAGELIADVSPSGHLVADVEGVAIVTTSATDGYILVSNQGDSTYAVLERKAPHAFIKTFRVEQGASCIDGVTGSDGIEATARNLGPAFPQGAFVTQDDSNPGGQQNFKLVPLQWILGTAPAADDSQCSSEPPASDAGVPTSDAGNSAGWGASYCQDFCAKCAACYATGTFSEGDCHYQTVKPNFDVNDCAAGCAVSATPGVAAHGTLTAGWQSLSCAAFDDAM